MRSSQGDWPRAEEKIRRLYAPDVCFRDPLGTVSGIEAFVALNRRIFGDKQRIEVHMGSVVQVEGRLFAAWRLLYEPALGPALQIEGVTDVRLREGRVVYRRDLWDLLGATPATRTIIDVLSRRFLGYGRNRLAA